MHFAISFEPHTPFKREMHWLVFIYNVINVKKKNRIGSKYLMQMCFIVDTQTIRTIIFYYIVIHRSKTTRDGHRDSNGTSFIPSAITRLNDIRMRLYNFVRRSSYNNYI